MNISLSKGNRKLSKNVLIWNLPRLKTCPGAGACKDWCYEIKIERMYRNVIPYRTRNLAMSLAPQFVTKMVAYLSKRKEPYIRVHESGDFYDQIYLDKWYAIARQLPNKKFFAFTKSFHLNLWMGKPLNFNILQSNGSRWDNLINWNHPTNRAILKGNKLSSKEYLCPFNGKNVGGCGDICTVCMDDPKIHVVGYIH